jgi:phospholipase/carboxylesterase
MQAATLYAMNSGESATVRETRPETAGGLETVEVQTGPEPKASVIWLHGLGADGHDFEPIVPQLVWPGAPNIRYVFPHAPVRPVTINGGMPMRAWYDILSLNSARGHDRDGIVDSVNLAAALVRREISSDIPSNRVIVAGFSQGGAIALQLALRFPEPLAGVVALSSYLLFADRLAAQQSDANAMLPVFIGHGTSDPVVPFSLGEEAASQLRDLGHPVEWHSYPMVHAVCPEEIDDLASWMASRLE